MCPPGFSAKSQSLLLCGKYADLFAVAAQALKLDSAVDQRKKGIVGTDADILAGMDMRPTLLDKDIPRKDELAVAPLDAKTLRFGIAPVLRGAHSFFMRKKLNIYF